MGRFRLDPPPMPRPERAGRADEAEQTVRAGVSLHHRTDELFHRHPWFTERVRSLRDDLEAAGLPRGAARAIAHVGPEMLLDGVLLSDVLAAHSVTVTLAALDEHHERIVRWASPEDAWSGHLRLLIHHGLPTDYADPEAVAHRLLRILGRRHRLGFAGRQVPLVARLLADRQPSIEATGRAFLEELLDAVAGPQDGQPRDGQPSPTPF
jgi:hypothetical protein